MGEREQSKKTVDLKVIQRLMDGDEEAFEIVYHSYYKYIYYMALQYFNDDDYAKDIVQETFLKAYKSIHGLQSPEAFTVWIKRIAFTICHDKYKARKKDSMNYADGDNELLDVIFENENVVSPTDKILYDDVKLIVMQTLKQMKPEIRVIGYLRFFEQLNLQEIAEVTGNSIGTVGSRIARLKIKLQNALKENGYSTTTSYSIAASPLLFKSYEGWTAALEVPDIKSFSKVTTYHSSKVNGAHVVTNTASKFYPYIAIAGALLASVLGVKIVKESMDERLYVENEIIAIHYDDAYVNHALDIKIETKNEHYDAMLIDGEEGTKITKNGKHTISIMKNGDLLDEKEINITNIDMDPPVMTDSVISDTSIKISVADRGSGIDWGATVLDGNDANHLQFDRERGMFILDKDINKEAILNIYDQAGNTARVKISQIETFRRIK